MWNQTAASALRCSSLVCHFICRDGETRGASLPPHRKRTNHPGDERRRRGGGEEGGGGRKEEEEGRRDRQTDRKKGRLGGEKKQWEFHLILKKHCVDRIVGIVSPSPQA